MSHPTLHQMVRLRDLLKRWRRRALRHAHSSSDLSRGASSSSSSSSLGRPFHTRRSLSMPSPSQGRVPAGHIALYVGDERKRFVIKMSFLSHPLFKALLKKTEEEMGFHHQGALAIPCQVPFFEHLLHLIQSHHHSHHNIMTILHLSSPRHSASPHDHSHHRHRHRRRHSEEYPLPPHFQELLQQLLHLSSSFDSTHHHSNSSLDDSTYHHHHSSPSLCNLTHSLSSLNFSSVNGASQAVLA